MSTPKTLHSVYKKKDIVTSDRRPATRVCGQLGFSLLELLMVLTLAPIVFFTLYSSFSAGLRIWSTVVSQTPEEDLNIFYMKTRRDIENMLRYDPIPFSGDNEEAAFASVIEAPAELGGRHAIGQVRFFYDPSSKTVRRETKNISQLHKDSAGQVTVLLKGVTSFALFYLSNNQTGDDYSWSDSWAPQSGTLPVALRLSFKTADTPDRQERIVYVPVGGRIK